MSWRHRWAISVFVIALLWATSVSAGTTPASAEPPPAEPMAQLLNYLRNDPRSQMVSDVLYGETTDETKIVVSDAFRRASYQERFQMVQRFGFTWGKIHIPSDLVVTP
jgi:hypothetical protein